MAYSMDEPSEARTANGQAANRSDQVPGNKVRRLQLRNEDGWRLRAWPEGRMNLSTTIESRSLCESTDGVVLTASTLRILPGRRELHFRSSERQAGGGIATSSSAPLPGWPD